MATRLYFHAAASAVGGTLPTTEQSAKTSIADFESQATNRSMDTTIGVAQATLSYANTTNTGANSIRYVSKFVSAPLDQTSIALNTWRYNFAAKLSRLIDDYPCNDTSKKVPICVYVWRPSTGAKVGNIFDTNSTSVYSDLGSFSPSLSTTSETSEDGTFSGSAVAGVQTGDVIIFEVWINVYTRDSISTTLSWFYDGTVETLTTGTTVSDQASFLETPENLVFAGAGPASINRQYNSYSNTGFMPSVASVTF
jgi:hypothetical protein